METTIYVFCDWTLLDMIGRFIMFCLWGYFMGKSVTHSVRTTWSLTFLGVLVCALLHTWMQIGELQQFDIYPGGMHDATSEKAGGEFIFYFIKVFIFYLTASIIGYRAGRLMEKKIRADLNRIQTTLNRWEDEGLIEKSETNCYGHRKKLM